MNRSQRARRRQRRREPRDQRRYGKLYACLDFDKVFSPMSLFAAERECRRGVGWKASVINVDRNAMLICAALADRLADGSYRPARPSRFTINERGKMRRISAVRFQDRIVQRALCDNSLVPMVSYRLIDRNAASLKGRGTSFMRDRFQRDLNRALSRWDDPWACVFDFSDYFHSIDSKRAFDMAAGLYRSLCRTDGERADCERILAVLRLFACQEEGLGLGNQTSQTLAILYADPLDHWACGQGLYGRYMDDAYCFVETRGQAGRVVEEYGRRATLLGLTLNPRKTRVLSMKDEPIPMLKRVYRWTGGGWDVRLSAKARRMSHRHINHVIDRYDGINVDLDTMRMLWESRLNLADTITSPDGWLRMEAESMRRRLRMRGVEFDPTLG